MLLGLGFTSLFQWDKHAGSTSCALCGENRLETGVLLSVRSRQFKGKWEVRFCGSNRTQGNVSEEVQAGSPEEKGPLSSGRRDLFREKGSPDLGGGRLDKGFEVGLRPINREEWSREKVEKGRGVKGGQEAFCARHVSVIFFPPLKLEPISIVLPGLLS